MTRMMGQDSRIKTSRIKTSQIKTSRIKTRRIKTSRVTTHGVKAIAIRRGPGFRQAPPPGIVKVARRFPPIPEACDVKDRHFEIALSTPDRVASAVLSVSTNGKGFFEITRDIARFVAEASAREGLVTVFTRHTSASLTIQENADPDVLVDLATALDRLAPEGGWRHESEGSDDMPAHIKSMLTGTFLQIPVTRGALALGQWQGVYLVEHRRRPHHREVVLQFIGSGQ